MKKFACWKLEDARNVINPDVDAQEDAIVAAVHTNVPIRKQDQTRLTTKVVAASEVLEEFKSIPRYVLMPVLGSSGSGKSHFIRWMHLNLRGLENEAEILFVPKAKTNLRDIILDLIDRLPDDKQHQYRELVQGTGSSTFSVPAQRSMILNNLQTQLENDRSYIFDQIDRDEAEYLTHGLGSLFIDPYIREQHLMRDDSFAAELASHVFEKPDGYQPVDERREFHPDDFPITVEDFSKAAAMTGEFLGYLLGNQASLPKAAFIVNSHLDAAISNCLNLSGDHLIAIITEIRRHLKQQGKELIILIEDFARLQGLDRALLQSLLEQGDEDICTIRTAFACTTGFYNSLEATVQTRLSFVLDLDNVADGSSDAFDVVNFVAKYMNAVRVGKDRIVDAWENGQKQSNPFNVENGCNGCEHKSVCHNAFGEVEGFGLYPFTKNAIHIMANKADTTAGSKFNARRFQRKVLQPVCLEVEALVHGHFPPRSLLEGLGGAGNFPQSEQAKLRDKTDTDWERHLTLISLWSGEIEAKNLSDQIHRAFDLQLVTSFSTHTDASDRQSKTRETLRGDRPVGEKPRNSKLDEQCAQIDRWSNDSIELDQNICNQLRPLIFRAIEEFVRWDDIGLTPKRWYSKEKGIFKQSGIVFQNQSTQARIAEVSLKIPRNWDDKKELSDTTSALKALLEVKNNPKWDFPGANEKFVCLQECIANWATDVTDQLQRIKLQEGKWAPEVTAFEICALHGMLTAPDGDFDQLETVLECAYAGNERRGRFLSPNLETIAEKIEKQLPSVRGFLKDETSRTKGGSVGNFVCSIKILERTSKTKSVGISELPASTQDIKQPEYLEIYELARFVREKIDAALKDEVDLRLRWLEDCKKNLGEDKSALEISEMILRATNNLADENVEGVHDLQRMATTFRNFDLQQAVNSVKKVPVSESPRPYHVALSISDVVAASNELTEKSLRVLGKAKAQLNARLETSGMDPKSDRKARELFVSNLERVRPFLNGE